MGGTCLIHLELIGSIKAGSLAIGQRYRYTPCRENMSFFGPPWSVRDPLPGLHWSVSGGPPKVHGPLQPSFPSYGAPVAIFHKNGQF